MPSDDGILISAYGSINNSNSISTNIVEINNALNVSKTIFNLSISNDLVDINIIRCPLGMSESHYIAWYLKRLYGTEYPSFDYYQYELPYSENSFLNISIKKSIKSDIFPDNIVKSEIRSLCVDIFSAECGARHWFKARGNYVIWKIEKRNTGRIMIINNDNLVSLFSVKTKNKKYTIDSLVMNSDKAINFINFLNNSIIKKDKNINNKYGDIFFYNGGCGQSVFNKFLKIANSVFHPLNPFDAIKTSVKTPRDLYIGTSFAETGIGFNGLDV